MISFIVKSAVKLVYCAVAFIIVAAVVFTFIGGDMSLSYGDGGENKTIVSVEKNGGITEITVLDRSFSYSDSSVNELYGHIKQLLQ